VKRAFTIVELLVVIVVIGILGAIVTNAAMGSLKNARSKRADLMCTALQQAITSYYAQKGEWPASVEDAAEGKIGGDEDSYTFTPEQTDEIFQEVVGAGFGKSTKIKKTVLIDATALFVARRTSLGNSGKGCYDNHANAKKRSTFCGGRGCIDGVDFSTAVAKSGRHHIRFKDMAFGYQGTETGKFCRFWITYNRKTDSVTVSKRGPNLQ